MQSRARSSVSEEWICLWIIGEPKRLTMRASNSLSSSSPSCFAPRSPSTPPSEMPNPVLAAKIGSEMTLFRFGFVFGSVFRLLTGEVAVAIVGEVAVVDGDEKVE